MDGVAARGLVNEGPATKSWEGWSRNLFRRNQAKLTLPPLSSYPYKYERRRLNHLLVALLFNTAREHYISIFFLPQFSIGRRNEIIAAPSQNTETYEKS